MIDSYQGNDLNTHIERPCYRITCMNPIGKWLVESTRIFPKIDFIVDTLDFLFHWDGLSANLTI